MDDDIDIEEHDLLDNPYIRSIIPDLSVIKEENIYCDDNTYGYNEDELTTFLRGLVKENDNAVHNVQKIGLNSSFQFINHNSSPTCNYDCNLVLDSKHHSQTFGQEEYEEFFENHLISKLPNIILSAVDSYLENSKRFCYSCFILFSDTKIFNIHVEKKHSNMKELITVNCLKSRPSVGYLKQQKCNDCERIYYSRYDLKYHTLSCHKTPKFMRTRIYEIIQYILKNQDSDTCFHCKKAYESRKALEKHLFEIIRSKCAKNHRHGYINNEYNISRSQKIQNIRNDSEKIDTENNKADYTNDSYHLLNKNTNTLSKAVANFCTDTANAKRNKTYALFNTPDIVKKKKRLWHRCGFCSCFFKDEVYYKLHLNQQHKTSNVSKFPSNIEEYDGNCRHCCSFLNNINCYNAHIIKKHKNYHMIEILDNIESDNASKKQPKEIENNHMTEILETGENHNASKEQQKEIANIPQKHPIVEPSDGDESNYGQQDEKIIVPEHSMMESSDSTNTYCGQSVEISTTLLDRPAIDNSNDDFASYGGQDATILLKSTAIKGFNDANVYYEQTDEVTESSNIKLCDENVANHEQHENTKPESYKKISKNYGSQTHIQNVQETRTFLETRINQIINFLLKDGVSKKCFHCNVTFENQKSLKLHLFNIIKSKSGKNFKRGLFQGNSCNQMFDNENNCTVQEFLKSVYVEQDITSTIKCYDNDFAGAEKQSENLSLFQISLVKNYGVSSINNKQQNESSLPHLNPVNNRSNENSSSHFPVNVEDDITIIENEMHKLQNDANYIFNQQNLHLISSPSTIECHDYDFADAEQKSEKSTLLQESLVKNYGVSNINNDHHNECSPPPLMPVIDEMHKLQNDSNYIFNQQDVHLISAPCRAGAKQQSEKSTLFQESPSKNKGVSSINSEKMNESSPPPLMPVIHRSNENSSCHFPENVEDNNTIIENEMHKLQNDSNDIFNQQNVNLISAHTPVVYADTLVNPDDNTSNLLRSKPVTAHCEDVITREHITSMMNIIPINNVKKHKRLMYKCIICSCYFKEETFYKFHLHRQHKSLNILNFPAKLKEYNGQCRYCSSFLSNMNFYNAHIYKHHRQYYMADSVESGKKGSPLEQTETTTALIENTATKRFDDYVSQREKDCNSDESSHVYRNQITTFLQQLPAIEHSNCNDTSHMQTDVVTSVSQENCVIEHSGETTKYNQQVDITTILLDQPSIKSNNDYTSCELRNEITTFLQESSASDCAGGDDDNYRPQVDNTTILPNRPVMGGRHEQQDEILRSSVIELSDDDDRSYETHDNTKKPQNFECNDCFNKFATLRLLKRHIKRTHETPKLMMIRIEEIIDHILKDETSQKCFHCEKTFKNRRNLRSHLFTVIRSKSVINYSESTVNKHSSKRISDNKTQCTSEGSSVTNDVQLDDDGSTIECNTDDYLVENTISSTGQYNELASLPKPDIDCSRNNTSRKSQKKESTTSFIKKDANTVICRKDTAYHEPHNLKPSDPETSKCSENNNPFVNQQNDTLRRDSVCSNEDNSRHLQKDELLLSKKRLASESSKIRCSDFVDGSDDDSTSKILKNKETSIPKTFLRCGVCSCYFRDENVYKFHLHRQHKVSDVSIYPPCTEIFDGNCKYCCSFQDNINFYSAHIIKHHNSHYNNQISKTNDNPSQVKQNELISSIENSAVEGSDGDTVCVKRGQTTIFLQSENEGNESSRHEKQNELTTLRQEIAASERFNTDNACERQQNNAKNIPKQCHFPESIQNYFYRCPYCSIYLTKLEFYYAHLRKKHKVSNRFYNHPKKEVFVQECRYCSTPLKNKQNYYVHIATRHKDFYETVKNDQTCKSQSTFYRCEVCSCFFKRKKNFYRHRLKKHKLSSIKNYLPQIEFLGKCKYCQVRLTDPNNYNLHVNLKHKDYFDVDVSNNDKIESRSQKLKNKTLITRRKCQARLNNGSFYRCPYCSIYFKTLTYYGIHLRNKHKVSNPSDYPPEKDIFVKYCVYCSFPLKNIHSYYVHIVNKHKDYFETIPNVSKRDETYKAGSTFYRCEVCSCFFKQKRKLIRHRLMKHKISRRSNYLPKMDYFLGKCKYCQCTVTNPNIYNTHVLLKHKDHYEANMSKNYKTRDKASKLQQNVSTASSSENLDLKDSDVGNAMQQTETTTVLSENHIRKPCHEHTKEIKIFHPDNPTNLDTDDDDAIRWHNYETATCYPDNSAHENTRADSNNEQKRYVSEISTVFEKDKNPKKIFLYRCDVCSCFFESKKNLISHKFKNHKISMSSNNSCNKEKFLGKCTYCQRCLKYPNDYNKHVFLKHRDYWRSSVFPITSMISKKREPEKSPNHFEPQKLFYRCLICSTYFTKLKWYTKHIQKNHHLHQNVGKLVPFDESCRFCDLSFSTTHYYKKHVVEMHSKYYNLKTKNLKIVLDKCKPYEDTYLRCFVCSCYFINKTSYYSHLVNNHGIANVSEEKYVPFDGRCMFCTWMFDFMPYNAHIHDYHLNHYYAKPAVDELKNKSQFTLVSSNNDSLLPMTSMTKLIVDGTKSFLDSLLYYKCNVCSCYFEDKATFFSHMNVNHKVIEHKELMLVPFAKNCDFCSIQNESIVAHRNHVLNFHFKEYNFVSKTRGPIIKCGIINENNDLHNLNKADNDEYVSKNKEKDFAMDCTPDTNISESINIFGKDDKFGNSNNEKLTENIHETIDFTVEHQKVPDERVVIVFKCGKCDIHFTSAKLAIKHEKHSEMLINWKCSICHLLFKKDEENTHHNQHLDSENVKILSIVPSLQPKVLYCCPKCTIHFTKNGFSNHLELCGSYISNSVYCHNCDILIDHIIFETHRYEHEIEKLERDDFTIINLKDNVPNLKRKMEINENILPAKIARKDSSIRDILFYCEKCKCYFQERIQHLKDGCLNDLPKIFCRICGLVTSFKTIHSDKCILTSKKVAFFDMHTCREIIPPMPEYPMCPICGLCFTSELNLKSHLCGNIEYEKCNLCNMKFTKNAFKIHMSFHDLKNKISLPSQNLEIEKQKHLDVDLSKTVPAICVNDIKPTNSVHLKESVNNIMFSCNNCDITVDDYDKVIEHCQNHYSSQEIEICPKKCTNCGLSFDTTSYESHQKLHLQKCEVLKFDTFYFTAEKSIWINHLFKSWHEYDINKVVDNSIYKFEHRIKLHIQQDGLADLTVYKCDKCGCFINGSSLYRHADNSCFKLRQHQCSFCGIPFASSESRFDHEIIHYRPGNITFESYRVVLFNRIEDHELNIRLYNHSKYVLYQCRNCFGSEDTPKNHVCDVSNLQKCNLCGLLFLNRKMEFHMQRHKDLIRFVESNLKIILFGDERDSIGSLCLLPTLKNVFDYTFYRCNACDNCVRTLQNAIRHMCAKGTKCPNCELSIITTEFKSHCKLHKIDPDFLRRNFNIVKFVPLKPIPNLKMCQDLTNDSKIIDKTQKNANSSHNVNDKTKIVSLYKCTCGLHFLDSLSLTRHIRSCNANIYVSKKKCSKCGLLFTSNVLQGHMLEHHGDETEIYTFIIIKEHKAASPLCGEQSLSDSRNNTPEDTLSKPLFRCTMCCIHFVNKNEAVNHFATCISDSVGWECSDCHLFFDHSSLELHKNYHHKDAPNQYKIIDIE